MSLPDINLYDPLLLTKQLIEKRSITPHDDGIMDLLKSKLEAIGFQCHILEFSDENETVLNLYAETTCSNPQALNIGFAGHVDVVPPGDLDLWSNHPFQPTIKDGILYGRGAVDMKTTIACFIRAAYNLLEKTKENPNIKLSLIISGEEENTSVNGMQKLLVWLKDNNIKIDYMMFGEPTSYKTLGDQVKIGRRGSVNFKLEVIGLQGHAAYPEKSNNPITKIIKVLYILKSTPLDDGTEFFQASNLEIVDISSDNLDKVSNVTPNSAYAMFNVRFNDAHSSEQVSQFVKDHCNKELGEDHYKLEIKVSGESFVYQPSIMTDFLTQSIKEVTSITSELTTTGGTSDARFIGDYSICFEFGALNTTAHKIDEHIPVKSIEDITKIYSLFLEKAELNAPNSP